MKIKIFLLSALLILAVSCAKDNPLNSSNNNNKITIANYEGTYEGKAKYNVIPNGRPTEENVSLIVNKNSTIIFQTSSKNFSFSSISEIDHKNYMASKTENNANLILYLVFDGNGNVSIDYTIQNQNGTSEKYTADKLTKKAS